MFFAARTGYAGSGKSGFTGTEVPMNRLEVRMWFVPAAFAATHAGT
jgi:hypothetical protein